MTDSSSASEAKTARDAATAEAVFQTQVWGNLRRNYAAHLMHGLLGQTGLRLINAPTFIPAYIHMLSGSDIAVGIARGLQALAMAASPIFGATHIEHRRRVLPSGFVVGGAMRAQILGVALAGFFLPPSLALLLTVLFLMLFGAFLGVQAVIFNYLMSKVIPVERRGFLVGLRLFLSGLTAAAVASVGGHLVDINALGNGYAATFLLAFVLTTVGLVALVFVREPEPPTVRAPSRVRQRLRELPALLRSDPAFTRYFLARALGTLGRMGMPFYVLHAGERVGLTGTLLGELSVAFMLAQTTTNLVWGWIADRTGFRLVFLCALGVWMASTLALIEASTARHFVLVFVGLGAGSGGFQMSAQNLLLEFGEREDLPMRIAVAGSASETMGAIGPVVGGTVAAMFSYVHVFWIAAFAQAAAIAVVLVSVDEPRNRPTN